MAAEGRPRSYHTVAVNIQWVVSTGTLTFCAICYGEAAISEGFFFFSFELMALIFTLMCTGSCQALLRQVCSFQIRSNPLNSTQLDSDEDAAERKKWTVAE